MIAMYAKLMYLKGLKYAGMFQTFNKFYLLTVVALFASFLMIAIDFFDE